MRKKELNLGKRLLAVSISILLVALTACTPTPAPTPTPTPTPTPSAAATPTTSPTPAPSATTSPSPYVAPPAPPATPTGPPYTGLPKISGDGKLTAPKASSISLTTSSVFCEADFTNMYIVKRTDKNVEGQGHVDFYLDMPPITTAGVKAGVLPSPAPTGAKVVIADAQANIAGTVAMAVGVTYTFTGVSNGNHTFAAQLVQNDDTPFNPPIFWAPVTVNVNKPAPSPSASSK